MIVKTLSTHATDACIGLINKYSLQFAADKLLTGVPKEIRGLVLTILFAIII